MKGRRHTTQEKIRILREADQGGRSVQDVCRDRKISEQTFYRWKREFGMLEVNQAKQLKELQKENAQLKRMLADESHHRDVNHAMASMSPSEPLQLLSTPSPHTSCIPG